MVAKACERYVEMQSQIKSIISTILVPIGVLAVMMAIVAGLAFYSDDGFRQYVARIAFSRQQAGQASAEDWERVLREHNASLGTGLEEIVLVEFSDFQCPYCRRFTESVRPEILSEYGDRLRFVFKHFPLVQAHPQARMMAIAAQCAARENRFWDVHRMFFSQSEPANVDGILAIGDTLGLSSRYETCVLNEETAIEVAQDMADAQALGVQGTPTFLVNGRFIAGNQPVTAFRSLIEEAISEAD